MTDPMTRPTVHPLAPAGREGQRLRFSHGPHVLVIDTSVASGEVHVTRETMEPDGTRTYEHWRGSLGRTVALLLAADRAGALLEGARRG